MLLKRLGKLVDVFLFFPRQRAMNQQTIQLSRFIQGKRNTPDDLELSLVSY